MAQSLEDENPGQSSTATATTPIRRPDSLEIDRAQQLTFLYKALDDNQNLIKFLDAKAAFAVALLSAMIGKILSDFGAYFPWNGQSHYRQLLVLGFAVSAIIAVVLVGLIVFPTINPALNTSLLPPSGPLFFITQFDPKKWRRIFSRSPKCSRLAQTHSDYLTQITAADNELLLQIVSGEVLKVSYIRQIKADRFKALAISLVICSILFSLLLVSDATVAKPIKPMLVHVDNPVRVDGSVTLSPPPPIAQPSDEHGKPRRNSNRP